MDDAHHSWRPGGRRKRRTDSIDLLFQGVACANRGTTLEVLQQARGYFERALTHFWLAVGLAHLGRLAEAAAAVQVGRSLSLRAALALLAVDEEFGQVVGPACGEELRQHRAEANGGNYAYALALVGGVVAVAMIIVIRLSPERRGELLHAY